MNVRYKILEPEYVTVDPFTHVVARPGLFAEVTNTYRLDPQSISGAGFGPNSPATSGFLNSQLTVFSSGLPYILNGATFGTSDWISAGFMTDVDGPIGPATTQTFLTNMARFLIQSFGNPTMNPENWDLNLVFCQVSDGASGFYMPAFCYFGNQGTHADLKLDEGSFTDLLTGMVIDEGNFTDAFNGTAVDEGTF